MEINVKALNGGSASKVSVSAQVFGRDFNEPLIHQVVTAYMAGGRQGTKAQKSRSEVSGGGKKPWKQKGSGRARAGSIRSPIWRKGGKTFAAVPRDYDQKVNKKMYRGAVCSILSELMRQNRITVIDTFEVGMPRTKEVIAKLKDLALNDVLIVTESVSENLYLASRNIPSVDVRDVEAVDPVSLIQFEHVLFTVDALKKLEEELA